MSRSSREKLQLICGGIVYVMVHKKQWMKRCLIWFSVSERRFVDGDYIHTQHKPSTPRARISLLLRECANMYIVCYSKRWALLWGGRYLSIVKAALSSEVLRKNKKKRSDTASGIDGNAYLNKGINIKTNKAFCPKYALVHFGRDAWEVTDTEHMEWDRKTT